MRAVTEAHAQAQVIILRLSAPLAARLSALTRAFLTKIQSSAPLAARPLNLTLTKMTTRKTTTESETENFCGTRFGCRILLFCGILGRIFSRFTTTYSKNPQTENSLIIRAFFVRFI